MLEFQEKRRLKKVLYSKFVLVLLIVIIILSLNAVWQVYKKQMMAKENLIQTASVFDQLKARESMLTSGVERLKTESGTEQEIREKYGLVKPGEEVIVVVKQGDSTSSEGISKEIGFWQKVLNWLK